MGRLHGRIDVRGYTTRGGPAASTPSRIAIFIRQFRLLCPLKSAVAARGGLFFEQLRRLGRPQRCLERLHGLNTHYR
jgi:hypothetical protein